MTILDDRATEWLILMNEKDLMKFAVMKLLDTLELLGLDKNGRIHKLSILEYSKTLNLDVMTLDCESFRLKVVRQPNPDTYDEDSSNVMIEKMSYLDKHKDLIEVKMPEIDDIHSSMTSLDINMLNKDVSKAFKDKAIEALKVDVQNSVPGISFDKNVMNIDLSKLPSDAEGRFEETSYGCGIDHLNIMSISRIAKDAKRIKACNDRPLFNKLVLYIDDAIDWKVNALMSCMNVKIVTDSKKQLIL